MIARSQPVATVARYLAECSLCAWRSVVADTIDAAAALARDHLATQHPNIEPAAAIAAVLLWEVLQVQPAAAEPEPTPTPAPVAPPAPPPTLEPHAAPSPAPRREAHVKHTTKPKPKR